MVIRNTRYSRPMARKPQVKEAPKAEEKKIEEVEIKEEPQIEVVIKEAPLQGDIEELDQQIKKPREKRKKSTIGKKGLEIEKNDKNQDDIDEVEELLQKLIENE